MIPLAVSYVENARGEGFTGNSFTFLPVHKLFDRPVTLIIIERNIWPHCYFRKRVYESSRDNEVPRVEDRRLEVRR